MTASNWPHVEVVSLIDADHVAIVHVHGPRADGNAGVSTRRPIDVGLQVLYEQKSKKAYRWVVLAIIYDAL